MVFHHMVLIFHSFEDLDLDMQVFQIWMTSGLEDFQTNFRQLLGSLPDDFQEVFQTTSRKSSRRLPGSFMTESSPMSLFHNRSESFGFNQMVLIFHLDMFYKSGFDIHVFPIWIRLMKTYG
ncbi:hypothetical protein F2Q69_00034593 [Brassica cretica]|uniref:Uncharacterized protein n=1 Tax=Brassica cretica TaxID=69181 RepID=A0A8S9STE4_BRACR|nr:hypothetical protein F2Q69_00034593 [Brassica cretica]